MIMTIVLNMEINLIIKLIIKKEEETRVRTEEK